MGRTAEKQRDETPDVAPPAPELDQPAPETDDDAPEPETETEGEQPAEEDGDGLEVIDEPDGAAPSPADAQMPVRKYLDKKARWKAQQQEAAETIESLKQRLQLAEMQLELHQRPAGQPQAPQLPNRDDYDTDDDYGRALDSYIEAKARATGEAAMSERERSAREQAAQIAREQAEDEALTAYYARAAKLKAPDFDEREQAFRQIFDDRAALQIIASFENSEALVYALGRNPTKAQAFADKLKSNPVQGLIELTRYADGIKTQPRTKAPPPDEPIKGAGGGSSFQAKLDAARRAYEKGRASMADVLAIKREARRAGVLVE